MRVVGNTNEQETRRLVGKVEMAALEAERAMDLMLREGKTLEEVMVLNDAIVVMRGVVSSIEKFYRENGGNSQWM